MHPEERPQFSCLEDPTVPKFDASRILLVMDGNCTLCSRAARFIARRDHHDQIRITPVTSELGSAILSHYGLDPADPATWLMLADGHAYGSLDAILRLGPMLHFAFRLAAPLRLLPRAVQDWLYARIARNRYALFGRSDICTLPDDALRRRLIL